MPETTPLIKAALNLRVGAGFDVYQVSHSHDASLRGVWTKDIPSQHEYQIKTYPHKNHGNISIFLQY